MLFAPALEKLHCTAQVKEFYEVFDMDGDEAISFLEWLLVKILTSIPEKFAGVVFDIMDMDDSGGVSLQHFITVRFQGLGLVR